MASDQITKNQHYVTRAYLRGWAGPDRKVWETSLNEQGEAVEAPVDIDKTGCGEFLYAVDFGIADKPNPRPDALDTELFKENDKVGARLIRGLRENRPATSLKKQERRALAEFLNAQLFRDPNFIEEHTDAELSRLNEAVEEHSMTDGTVEAEIWNEAIRTAIHYPSYARAKALAFMAETITDKDNVKAILDLKWEFHRIQRGDPAQFLTSDLPLLFNGGKVHFNDPKMVFLVMALSPKLLFIGYRADLHWEPRESLALAKSYNEGLLRRRPRWVYSKGSIQKERPDLWEQISRGFPEFHRT